MFTLYHAPGSCSLAIRAALALVDASFTAKSVSLSKGEHKLPDFLRLNPFGKVPALDIGDIVLTEGLAIHLYLAEQFPDRGLLPLSQPARAEALRWLAFVYTTVHSTYAHLFHPERFGDDTDSIRRQAEATLFEHFALISERLRVSRWLSGDQPGAADLYLMVSLHWQGVLQGSLTDTYPVFRHFIERMFAHEVVGEVFKSELQLPAAA